MACTADLPENETIESVFYHRGDNDDDKPFFDPSDFCFPAKIWYRVGNAEVVTKSAAVVPIALTAILGNLAVIRILLQTKLTRNPINKFILNLSISNFLCTLVFPWVILINHFYQNFMTGKFMCKTEGFFIFTLMLAKALSITAISFDQLTSVVNPYRARMGAGKAKNVVWAIWMISVVCASPLIIWRTYHERKWKDFHEKWCHEDMKTVKFYWPILMVLLVWLPLLVLVISYIVIMVKLEAMAKRRRNQAARAKLKSKVARMLLSIAISFAICWFPFSVFIVIRSNMEATDPVPSGFRNFYFVVHYLMFVNSAVNPIIYGWNNDSLRREVRLALPKSVRPHRTCEISTVYEPQRVSIHAASVAERTYPEETPGLMLAPPKRRPTYFNYYCRSTLQV